MSVAHEDADAMTPLQQDLKAYLTKGHPFLARFLHAPWILYQVNEAKAKIGKRGKEPATVFPNNPF